VPASPGSFQARKDLAESWSAVSDLLRRLRRYEGALEASRRAIALFEQLRAANPGQTRLRQLLAVQYYRQALVPDSLAARGALPGRARGRDACMAFRRSLELWRDLEATAASVDTENKAQRAEVEKAVACCDGARDCTVEVE
jgi:hypothetical protein